MKALTNHISDKYSIVKKFGLLGFLFFLCKGILWIIAPVILTYFGISTK